MSEVALELKNIKKSFGGIRALKGVDLRIKKGEVHALMGENGAGKSTLIKILTGIYSMEAGQIFINNKSVIIDNPVSARYKGIVAIYQELSLIENLTVAQNIFLGHEPTKSFLGWNDRKELNKKAAEYLQSFNIHISPSAKICDLGLGEKRIIEILKALSINAQILLLDEPTTGMSKAEIDTLFKIMDELKKKNVTMIYISHYIEEIYKVCDSVTVLRDGENAGSFAIEDIDEPNLIKTMIGRELDEEFVKGKSNIREVILLEAKDYLAEEMVYPISFQLHAGEILGITGIIGAGKSELGMALFGAAQRISGELFIKGKQAKLSRPEDAKKNGVAFIPEDRKTQGLFQFHSVADNLTVVNIEQVMSKSSLLSMRKKKSVATNIANKLRIAPLDTGIKAQNLSGGNQQKVVIGKWLSGNPDIIVMDEPTRGIDVGAKTEIYNIIRRLTESGKGVIILSSEFKEIGSVCDRIIVLKKGKVVGEISAQDVSTEKILTMALGG